MIDKKCFKLSDDCRVFKKLPTVFDCDNDDNSIDYEMLGMERPQKHRTENAVYDLSRVQGYTAVDHDGKKITLMWLDSLRFWVDLPVDEFENILYECFSNCEVS